MNETLHTRFQRCVDQYRDKAALMTKVMGSYQTITWREFGESVCHFALGLSTLGVKKGDRVALLSENRPAWAISDLAILSEGAITVPIYPTSTPKQIAYILNNSECRVVIISTGEQLLKIRDVKDDLLYLEKIVVMDKVEDKEVLQFEDVLKRGKQLSISQPGLYEEHAQRAVTKDTATIIYTSGTTGDPKGVMLSHGNILFNCDAADCVVPVTDEDICLSFLPLSHVFERTVGQFFMIFRGVTIAYAEGIDMVAENMGEVRPTLMISVPRLFEKMNARVLEKVHQSPKVRQKIFFWGIRVGRRLAPYRLRNEKGPLLLRIRYAIADHLVFQKIRDRLGGRLRYFVSGGAPLSREVGEFFYAAGVAIIEGYGLTESSPVISANRHDQIRFGSIGKPLPGVEVRIAKDGEILTRSPSVMQGYYKNQEATREVIDKDGWLYTGDVGVMDEQGFITITDRKKDIIVTSGGKNVSPQNIENLLISDKFISQVMVYGDKRKYLTALVVPDFKALSDYWAAGGVTLQDPHEMIRDPRVDEFLLERIHEKMKDMSGFEQLKKIALLDREFSLENGELTPTMKLRRKNITQKYFSLLDQMYEKEF